MTKVNIQLCSYRRQSPICGIKQRFCSDIILRSEPFPFHNTPKGLHNVQMRRVWGNVEKKKSPFSHIGRIRFIFSLRCTLALSSTTNVFQLSLKENLSRKSTTFSASTESQVQKPSKRLFLSIIPKMLSRLAFSTGM